MQDNIASPYEMRISLRVLDHLGLNLYSNTPAVISEVIANAWDADATRVEVTIDTDTNTITVADNGHGMDLNDINNRYLLVGYRRREKQGRTTPKGRSPMGRKGIGKLSLFSIAKKITVYSRKVESDTQAFLMDADAIRKTVEDQEDTASQRVDFKTPSYNPTPVDVDDVSLLGNSGTTVKISHLKKNLTNNSVAGLRKRIARRFGLLDEDFKIIVNEEPVGFSDRDYFHKARFLFQYGDYDYAAQCSNLDTSTDDQKPLVFRRASCFRRDGSVTEDGHYSITGWIAIAKHSNDLDDNSGEQDDNLNKITILMRGKVAQEDILQEYRLGGMITKYIFGEIHADFLDDDDEEDIATTSRQHLAEDHPRYIALKNFIRNELLHIWTETNKLKEKRELDTAFSLNPHVKQWYDDLDNNLLRDSAKSYFRGIDSANMDDDRRHNLYANAVLAFEHLKMKNALTLFEDLIKGGIDDTNVQNFMAWLANMDAIEAARYAEIVNQRLEVITKFRNSVDENSKEIVLQDYLFDHLWLLDPAWERATQYAEREKRLQNAIERVPIRGKKTVRPDIRYRRVSGAHVIIELKRSSVTIDKNEIEKQLNDYIEAVRLEISKDLQESQFPIEAICLAEKLPNAWNKPHSRAIDEQSLRLYGIRVMTYTELINRAHSAYAKFVEGRTELVELSDTVDAIRSYRPLQ